MDRREFMKLGTLGVGAAALSGCDGVWSRVAEELGARVPETLTPPSGVTIDPAHHLLNRAAFGPWPGDVERVKALGRETWIDEQLEPDSIDDTACRVLTRRFESLEVSAGNALEFKPAVVERELIRFTLLKAIYSRRQLYESMVHFFTDHLNIALGKSDCRWFKPSDDRDVIRPHALGNFRTLLRASAMSPAMLVYLDGGANKKEKEADIPNENYARELLELHTLGVAGGYTQKDVMEAARCLTGFVVRSKWNRGTVEFRPHRHDDGEKIVLGTRIPAGGGENDLDRLLDILCAHPSTARFLARKLCRFFVADDPPESAIESAARAFTSSGGEIRPAVRAILRSDEFQEAAGCKLKRPFRFVVSALRALGARTRATGEVRRYLERMGQVPFDYPTPDGYPVEPYPWLGTLLWRWNFALALCEGRLGTDGEVPWDALKKAMSAGGKTLDEAPGAAFALLVGREPSPAEREALGTYARESGASEDKRRAVALILCSPAFQWH